MSGPTYRAPQHDFGILAQPPLSAWYELATENRRRIELADAILGGEPLESLRARARHDFQAAARHWNSDHTASVDGPAAESLWLMTGHQPELYHPGVWAKNFAVSAVAQAHGIVGVNLVADTDQFKSSQVRVPGGSLAHPSIQKVAFDTISDGRPNEAWHVADEAVFDAFGRSVSVQLSQEIADPLVNSFWPEVIRHKEETGSRRISLARQAVETLWGFGLIEAPMSLWAETGSVQHLFCMILADLPRFHAIHEEELQAYRKARGIRSKNHPVADLGHENGWWESPLWVWRDAEPLRKSLWVKICNTGSGIYLRIDGESESCGFLPVRPDLPTDSGRAALVEMAGQGIRIRPRALVTTALCRTLLADLFVHGIGGAVYDELGDSIFSRFFGFMPPPYAVTSATLRLTSFEPSTIRAELDGQVSLRRRLMWKAETVDSEVTEVKQLLNEKQFWLAQPTQEKAARRRRAIELRKLNRRIASLLADEISQTELMITKLKSEVEIQAMARSREFSIVVHSEQRLRRLANQIRTKVGQLVED